jgi:predicted  nucleic acid-binding Zn-ribbon protein
LQRKTGLVEEKTETSRDLVEMMKLNLKESDQRVRQLEQQVREL